MIIDSYTFGKIVVNGTTYTADLIIFPDRIHSEWWRKKGHLLQVTDLEEVLRESPDTLIIGTGYSGVMKVDSEVIQQLKKLNINYSIERTGKAVDLYNGKKKSAKVVAAFHLTC
jgi:hypothetical protein